MTNFQWLDNRSLNNSFLASKLSIRTQAHDRAFINTRMLLLYAMNQLF